MRRSWTAWVNIFIIEIILKFFSEVLIAKFGWEGSLFIVLGIICHMLIFAMVIHEFEGPIKSLPEPQPSLKVLLRRPQAGTMLFISVLYNGAILSDKVPNN